LKERKPVEGAVGFSEVDGEPRARRGLGLVRHRHHERDLEQQRKNTFLAGWGRAAEKEGLRSKQESERKKSGESAAAAMQASNPKSKNVAGKEQTRGGGGRGSRGARERQGSGSNERGKESEESRS